MANYSQSSVVNSSTRFSVAPMSGIEFSRMTANPSHITTMNAGDIVPIYYREVLPHQAVSFSIQNAVIRQTTVSTPTFGRMFVDFYAFFVPNRIVNESWKNVFGENSSGQWVAPEVSLVPLYSTRSGAPAVQVPIMSVADYYGFPTQLPIPAVVLQMCNDLKFRGYLEIYNTRFRDQNYQPPIPYSKLNIYEGFFELSNSLVPLSSSAVSNAELTVPYSQVSDGSSPNGAVVKALYGEGSMSLGSSSKIVVPPRRTNWSALDLPLKANKLHDYFTSVLPSPQKGPNVVFNISGSLPVNFTADGTNMTNLGGSLYFGSPQTLAAGAHNLSLATPGSSTAASYGPLLVDRSALSFPDLYSNVNQWNIKGDVNLSNSVGISITDLRDGAAIQQVYEILSRGGSRYREFINSFFGLEVDNPFCDIPSYLGHLRRGLDLYQTAQTAPSADGSTPQGNLAAFGYTATGGDLFQSTFVEHGYIHVFAVIRHRNLYSSFLSRDNFRMNSIDFYTPPLANISEQPVYTREINPFASDIDSVFGFQEAWSEYRYEPDFVSGYMREGIDNSLSIWNYSDEFDSGLTIADGDWMKSNSAEVLDRTLAVHAFTDGTFNGTPQFKCEFTFMVDKELPMPTYSVPGLDII